MHSELEELFFEAKSSQEKQIIKILLQYLDEIPNMKLEDVAKLCYCSKTSVRRIIMRLGYKGFIEYQLNIKLEQDRKEKLGNEASGSSKKFELENMSKFIKASDKVYIYGKGASSLAAQYAFRLLTELGYIAIWINEQDLLYSLTEKNILILSNYGITSSEISLVYDLKSKNKCNIGAITKKNSELAAVVDCSLVHNLEKSICHNDQFDLLYTINSLAKYL